MSTSTGRHINLPCPPGTKLLLEVAGLADKLTTASVGHAKGRFVVTHMPVVSENNRDAMHQMLYPDNTVIVRFLHGGTVMGFSASLIKAVQIPFPLLFLSYPSHLESHDLRRFPRMPCSIPAETELDEAKVQGMIVDLSQTGCQFSAGSDKSNPPSVHIDDRIVLTCPLLGTTARAVLPCVIKRVGLSEKRLDLGLKFTELAEETQTLLSDYLQYAQIVLE